MTHDPTDAPEGAATTRWVPGDRLVRTAAVPAAASAVTMFAPDTAPAVLALDGLFALAAATDWLTSRGGAVEVQRTAAQVFALGRPNPVQIDLRNRTARRLVVEVHQDVFDGAVVEGLPARVALAPHGTARVRYSIRPQRRGRFELGDHILRIPTRLGLSVRQERIRARGAVHVYPDVAFVRQYEAWNREGRDLLAGSIRTRGGENEFERLRAYTRDDDIRHVDWRATARRRALTVRQYQTETEQSLVFLVDSGRTMRAEVAGLSLLDHAFNACVMLAHVALDRGDRVGSLVFDHEVRRWLPPSSGRSTEARLLGQYFDVEPTWTEPDYARVSEHLGLFVRQRSLVVLFTQVLDPRSAERVQRLLAGLTQRHLPVCVVFLDPGLESLVTRAPRDARDLYVGGAAAQLALERERHVSALRARGATVLQTTATSLTPALLKRYVEIKSRRLL